MATNMAPSTQSTTARNVIDMFGELNLPVCEDKATIEEVVKKSRNRYLKDLNNPTPDIRDKAKNWFSCVDLLQRNSDQLLDIVYNAFEATNDKTIRAFLASGTREVTKEMMEDFRENAIHSYCTRPDLAERFVDRYMKARNLRVGTSLVPTELIAAFKAVSRADRIDLSWKKPDKDFESVEIQRQDTRNGLCEVVYHGAGEGFVDTAADIGVWYVYRAHTINKNFKSKDFVSAPDRAIRLVEVSKQTAEWKDGKVHVSWEPSAGSTAAIVFRREGGEPVLRRGGGKPSPETMSTQPVFEGAGNSFTDGEVTEGATYHYLIVSQFGSDLFSNGVTVQVSIPKAPPSPEWLKAAYRMQGTENVVKLEWPAVKESANVVYLLVRRDGGTHAASPEDGLRVAETDQLGFLDSDAIKPDRRYAYDVIKPGRRYAYTVFARAGELYSRVGANGPPVDVVPDVSNLKAVSSDRTVELTWNNPPDVKGIAIRRRLEPPKNILDGERIKLSGPDSAKDTGLINDRASHYLVCCVYRTEGNATVVSRGVRISATPVRMPDPVLSLNVALTGLEVSIGWPDGDYGGTVAIFRSKRPHGLLVGNLLGYSEFKERLRSIDADPVSTVRENMIIDTGPMVEKPYYSSFTVSNNKIAAVGETGYCVANPDVDKLTVVQNRDGVVLTWDWPAGCRGATVARKTGGWPSGPSDPQATSVTVTKPDYLEAGGKYKQTLRNKGHYFYIVYAQATAKKGTEYATGGATGCRKDVHWRPWTILKYRLPKGPDRRDKNFIRLTWGIENPHPDFAGFLLVADQDNIPQGADDGVELFRWTPENGDFEGLHEARVPLEPVKKAGWPHFYCKLMVLDPLQAAHTLIVHPDICEQITPGRNLTVGKIVKRADLLKTPRSVVCPFCLDAFPVEKMLFAPSGGGPPVQGVRNWWDRLRNRPVRPPKDKAKGAMTHKICPVCKRELHASAGVQKSLIVGMVGAKHSGKSHYVASLVHQLGERGSKDMYAGLLPLDEETVRRYTIHFHKPLFVDHLELDGTVGVQPPLLYDLAFDGSLWKEERGCSVSLSLYDTAGENFNDPKILAQTVKYLRVASGIIFLVDPLQCATVRNNFPEHIKLPDLDPTADPLAIIRRVLEELQKAGILPDDKQPIDKPVAVVLTKCDELQKYGLIPENRLWTMDERHVGRFRRDIHEDMSGIMGEYMQKFNPAAYKQIVQRFPQHAFFGVSATGCASDEGLFPFISPWRVVDPLFWLLSELGVIPVEDD